MVAAVLLLLLLLLAAIIGVAALDNGVGRTPPMGFNVRSSATLHCLARVRCSALTGRSSAADVEPLRLQPDWRAHDRAGRRAHQSGYGCRRLCVRQHRRLVGHSPAT